MLAVTCCARNAGARIIIAAAIANRQLRRVIWVRVVRRVAPDIDAYMVPPIIAPSGAELDLL
jgi:hypothetical protein